MSSFSRRTRLFFVSLFVFSLCFAPLQAAGPRQTRGADDRPAAEETKSEENRNPEKKSEDKGEASKGAPAVEEFDAAADTNAAAKSETNAPAADPSAKAAANRTPANFAVPQTASPRNNFGVVDIFMMLEYRRDEMKYTGRQTLSNQFPEPVPPFSFPEGPIFFVPGAFEPNYEQLTGYASVRIKDYGFEKLRFNTQVSFRYTGELDDRTEESPFLNIRDRFVGRRILEPLSFYTDISGFLDDDRQRQFNVRVGRQFVYGAESGRLDGATISINTPRSEFDIFGGRRVTFYSDPEERAMYGGNFLFRANERTNFRYDLFHYIDTSHRFQLRHALGESWILDGGLFLVDEDPVDLNFTGHFFPADGKTRMSLSFLQKLSSDDYIYDYKYRAFAGNAENQIVRRFFPLPLTGEIRNGNERLNLGLINPYTQIFFDVYRTMNSKFGFGGSAWIRQVNDDDDNGPFDTSFQEFRVNADYFLSSAFELSGEYRYRNLSRRDVDEAESFSDFRHEGETQFHELYGNAAYNFFNNRLSLEGGLFYRRFDTQSRLISLDGIDTLGFQSAVKWRITRNYKLYLEYGIDDELPFYNPDIDYTQSFRVRFEWRFSR